MRGKWLTTLGACAFLAFFLGSSVHAQHNPSGKILGSGMAHVFPLEFGTGCDGGGADRLAAAGESDQGIFRLQVVVTAVAQGRVT